VHQRGIEARRRLVGDYRRPEAGQCAACDFVVSHNDDLADSRAARAGGDGVSGHGQRELRPATAVEAGEPGLGAGKYLDGDHQRPAG